MFCLEMCCAPGRPVTAVDVVVVAPGALVVVVTVEVVAVVYLLFYMRVQNNVK